MAKAPATDAIKVAMTHTKDTKGTFVFSSDDPDAAVTQLYVRRSAMKTPRETITLTIE